MTGTTPAGMMWTELFDRQLSHWARPIENRQMYELHGTARIMSDVKTSQTAKLPKTFPCFDTVCSKSQCELVEIY